MANDDSVACEIFYRFFESAEGIYVKIIARLIEQDDICAFGQHFGGMNAVVFTTRKHADFLLLVGAREVEGGDVSSGVHRSLAEGDDELHKSHSV